MMEAAKRRKKVWTDLKRQRYLHAMALPGILFLLVFCYLPMAGVTISFQEYDVTKGFLKSPFVGLAQFKAMFGDDIFWLSLRNSIGMSAIKVVLGMVLPVIFALLINEIANMRAKSLVQTISYLPHFISWVVVAQLFSLWLDSSGVLNDILKHLGVNTKPLNLLIDPGKFWFVMAFMDSWKETGWWAIVYLAAIAGIPQELYEVAVLDGARRFRRIWSITLPNITSTIVIIFILTMGSLLQGGLNGSNFSQSMLLGNMLNQDSSQILDTYVVKMGLQLGRLSFATAIGLVQSVLSLILFFGSNWLSKKISGDSVY